MKKIYIVTFEQHINCQIRDFVFHCEAENAKEACQIAKSAWSEKSATFPFHIHAVKSRIQNSSLLSVHNWKGAAISGDALIDTFHCIDFRVWRVNGRNLYGA